MKNKWLCMILIVLCFCTMVFGYSRPSSGGRGASLKAINYWNSSCSGGNRPDWGYMTDGWFDDIANPLPTPWGHGSRAWWKDSYRIDGYNVDSHYTDTSLVPWGRDYVDDTGIDEADAMMIAMHGSLSNSRWTGTTRVDESGSGNCLTWQGHMEFDYDLEFLHLSSCYSMDQASWGLWGSSFKGIRQVDGFHGLMWIWDKYRGRYKDFSDDAFNYAIANSWLDNLYVHDVKNDNNSDQCPCARGVGATEADLWNRMATEQYDWVADSDPTPNYHGVIYLIGCNPKGSGTLGASAGSTATAEPVQSVGVLATDWTEKDYYDLLNQVVPEPDSRLREVPAGSDWISGLELGNIMAAAQDEFAYEPITEDGVMVGQNTTETKFVKMDLNRGLLRYLNTERQFDYKLSPRQAIPMEEARAIAVDSLLAQLRLPEGEIAADDVVTVGAETQDAEGGVLERFEMEQLVTLTRQMNGYPVFGSEARVAVSNTGEISRLLVRDWPQFQVLYQGDLQLQTRSSIVANLTEKLSETLQGLAVEEIGVQQGFLRADNSYIPVMRVSVVDGLVGQIFIEPTVVMPYPDRDLDGVPDDIDNCPDTPNEVQRDSDQDGVGNICDNCPTVYNPDQRDVDNDGLGDACDTDTDAEAEESDPACGDPQHPSPRADLNGDCVVNLFDIRIIGQEWLVDCLNNPQDPICQPEIVP